MGKLLSAVITAALVLIALGSTPAQALQTGNSFTADNLPTWQTNGTVWALTTAQGKVFAGGTFTAIRPPGTADGDPASLTRTNLAVLDAATGSPTSCVLNVTRGSTSASVLALAASPDGSVVYVGGLFTTINAVNRQNIAAIDVSTCTVLPFNPKPSSFVYSITATASTVYFGGNFGNVGGVTRGDLGAATPAGALLPWAPKADDDVLGLAVDPNNGNVVIVGRMNLVNNQDSHAIVVVDGTNGTTNVRNYPQPFIPWSPGTGQRQGTSAIKTIATDSTGFYIGAEGTGGGVFDGRAAFDWSTYNQRWRDNCLGATQALASYNGVLFAGSHSHDCATENTFEDGARHYFTSETTADKKYLPWWPQGNDGVIVGPRAIAVAPSTSGDYLWYGGEFTSINGKAQRGLTRFGKAPDTSAPDAVQTPNVTSLASGRATVTVRTTQDADDKTLTYYLYRDSSTTPIATLKADSEFYYHPQVTYTDTGLTPGSTHTYRVRASDGTNTTDYTNARSVTVASATSTYATRVAGDGASIYFRMTEPSGSAAANSGSSTTAGTYVNASARVGQAGALIGRSSDTSASFDGTSSFLRTDVRQNAPTTYSAELWFKTTTTKGGRLIGFGDKALINQPSAVTGLSGSSDRQVYMSNDGTLTFGTRTAGGTVSTLKTSKAYNDGDWHQVVATQGSGGMALYMDGNRLARNSVTTALPGTGYWRIGGDAITSSFPGLPTSNFIAANIDEAAIYPTALTSTQIEAHYKLSGRTLVSVRPADAYGSGVYDDDPSFYWRLGETTGTTAEDSVQNGNTGTYSSTGVTRGVAGAISGTSDKAVTLDGTAGNVYSTSSSAGPKVYSEEAWFKTTTTTGGKILGFGSSQTGSSTTYDRHLYLGNDGKLRFGVYVAGYSVLTSPTALNNGAWHHVVAVQDATGQKLYVDGAVVASNAVAGNQTIATGYWRVGGDSISTGWPGSPTSKYLKGSVDEVAVYLKALTPAQVAAHRNRGIGQAVADTTAPTEPTGVTGTTAGANQVALSWVDATDDDAVAGYDVYRSTDPGFTPSDANRVGQTTTTSLTDVNVPPGTFYYLVVARDAAGNVSDPSNEASATVGDNVAPSAPTGLQGSADGGSARLSWTAATDDVGVSSYRVYRSTDPAFTPSASTKVAEVSETSTVDTPPASGAYTYRVVAVDAAGYEGPPSDPTTVSVVKADTTPPTKPADLSASLSGSDVKLSWTASTDDVAVARYDVHRSRDKGFTASASTKIGEATSGTTYTDQSPATGTWYYQVVAVDTANNAGSASDEDSVLVDLDPPTAPGALSAKVSGSTVTLSWTDSTDDTGVTGYKVYRSDSAGFTPSSSTLVDTVTDPTYTDLKRPTGTSYYRVVASDKADHTSASSDEVSATVAAPVNKTVTLAVSEDTMVAQAAPTTTYGSSATLASRGGSSAYTGFLKFEVPAAPSGGKLVGATLKLRTSSDDFAGSADAHSVTLAPTSWSESSLTWNTRPALGGTVGTVAKGTSKSQDLTVDLDAGTIGDQGTGTLGLALTSSSTDNLWVWSKNSQVSSYRPVLVLQYEVS